MQHVMGVPVLNAASFPKTNIHIMNMKKSDEFINGAASARSSLALQWIEEGPVGVMIASNLGRPGGACSVMKWDQTRHKAYHAFQEYANASTREESALTYIHSLTDRPQIPKQLDRFRNRFGMKPPTDTGKDFLVNKVTLDGGTALDRYGNVATFNVRNSDNPGDYDREFGSTIYIATHQIYISFVAGPNASNPPKTLWTSRADRIDDIAMLDMVFRTISYAALHDYRFFRNMILAALVASLRKIARLEYR